MFLAIISFGLLYRLPQVALRTRRHGAERLNIARLPADERPRSTEGILRHAVLLAVYLLPVIARCAEPLAKVENVQSAQESAGRSGFARLTMAVLDA